MPVAKKRGGKVSGLPKTRKIGTSTYKKSSCFRTKSEAQAAAKRKRSSGRKAAAIKNPLGGYCLFVGGKRKTGATKRKKRA